MSQRLIRVLDSKDALAFHKLLAQSFGSAEGFAAGSQTTRWGVAEDYYPTFGVFVDGLLVSMLRLEWILSQRELDYKLTTKYTNPKLTFPVMYLAKAATLPDYKNQGINSVLRYLCLQIALQWKAQFVFGSMVEGSPRIFTMREMGYKFQKLEKKWNGNFVSERTPLVAVLDLSESQNQAFHHLKSKAESFLLNCELQFNLSDIQICHRPEVRWPWTVSL